ncbi:MAG: A/G-specific adenine glycosylase [Bacteroidota bacterium]
MPNPFSPSQFQACLLQWFEQNDRPLPWKGEPDPYLIWLSEIILQQTRVEQGKPYFLRFKETFPTVFDLAAAPEDHVFKLWEGLGYYSRARNLHATAKRIAIEFDGVFPSTYENILSLKGVGPYTAAAIASFAYNLPHAVVDGNVYRVLARIWGLDVPTTSTLGKKQFQALADQLLDTAQPGQYNQAIMDFGATCCTPASPKCSTCPFQTNCVAHTQDRIQELPVKKKKIKKKNRYFHYVDIEFGPHTWIEQRLHKDIWQGLYQLPLIETPQLSTNWKELINTHHLPDWLQNQSFKVLRKSKIFKQTLSHQHIHAIFWRIQLSEAPLVLKENFIQIERKNLPKFAFPKIIDWYLSDNALYLNV